METKSYINPKERKWKKIVAFLHDDIDFLIAAEMGDHERIQMFLRNKVNINMMDHLGRNALHLAVQSGDIPTIIYLLHAGVNPTIKDQLGMTPLSLCLMRCPSVRVANLLFDHGAVILPRTCSMDSGLFMQFVIMCIPTREEEKILRLLVKRGGKLNDPTAPGGLQPLHFAAMSNNRKLVKILLSLGADISAKNLRGETAKEVALLFKCKDAFRVLDNIHGTAGVSQESHVGSTMSYNEIGFDSTILN